MVCNVICNVFVIVLEFSVMFYHFFHQGCLIVLYNAFLVILKAVVGLGLFLYPPPPPKKNVYSLNTW